MKNEHTTRREAIKRAVVAAGALSANVSLASTQPDSARVPLGLDCYSLRAMKWKSLPLIEYAAGQKLDAVLFNGLNYFESLETTHLKRVKETADAHGLRLYIGAGSISKSSTTFSGKFGSPEDLLVEAIRVAKTLGSPTINVRIGNLNDRYTEGGIEKNIEESVGVLRAIRNRAQDAGIKFGFENHAGDLRSEELLALIEAAGTDVCGVMLDPGNALWAMEDPMQQIQMLGKHVVCTSVRDYMVWPFPEGAIFQWTAIGQGLMDVPAFIKYMAELCPGVPLFVETISNSARPIPFLTKDYWKGYPKLRAAGIVDFLALLRRGHPLEIVQPPVGIAKKTFDQRYQRAEFEQSIAYLRRCCGAGNTNII